jgi:YegS/Rv2252/BmrU family lipid kinase
LNSYTFIVNPKAGRTKRDFAIAEKLKKEFSKRKAFFEIHFTERPGHATELARNATTRVVVAVGGDGTVNEVANGLIGSAKVLGIIPSGSGNDLVKSLDIPADYASALAKLLVGKTKRIDCATVKCEARQANGGNSTERYFVNGVGIGFDAAVAERTTHIHWLSGTALYLAAVFQMLGKYKSPDFKIKLDSTSVSSHNLLIAIGNGICAGGGFYLTPNAIVDDGKLDVCLIDEMSVPKILQLMPKVMKGKHEKLHGVQMKKAERITVSAYQPFFVHADGEMVGSEVNYVEVQIRKQALNVIVG